MDEMTEKERMDFLFLLKFLSIAKLLSTLGEFAARMIL